MDLYKSLVKSSVIMEGHWILQSGKHAKLYVNKDEIYSNPYLYKKTIGEMTDKIKFSGITFDIITGPAIAGICLASPIALSLNKMFVYPEKKYELEFEEPAMEFEEPDKLNLNCDIVSKEMEFRRGYDKKLQGKRIFITEDIITTGDSVEKTVRAIKQNGGIVVGVICIWNRSGWKLPNCTNLSLINVPVESWTPENCPLCQNSRSPLRDPKAIR